MRAAASPDGLFQARPISPVAGREPPGLVISPDGIMAWMAVEVEARYTRADKPAEVEKSFKSSWIATYQRAPEP